MGCQQSVKETKVDNLGKIVDLRTGQTFTPGQWVDNVVSQQHILIGEKHDNFSHHQAHYWLIEQLHQKRKQGALLLEMLRVDQQPLVDLVANNFAKNRSDLTAKLNWQSSWKWDFYRDIVQHPLEHHYALVATNLTQGEVTQILQGAEPLKGYISTEKKVKQQLADIIIHSHQCECNASDPHIQKMVEVQQFRDRRMAEKLLKSHTPNILIAGNHHINRQYGVPKHLADLSHNQKFITVLLADKNHNYTQADSDYVWILSE
ncbi:ChaN family lipoprotein [Ursidibacter maritimus]|nr:ChaN family lipoprotein [Ursidibacter maritimus]